MTLFAYLDNVQVGTSNIRLNAQGVQGIASLPAAADGTGSMGGIIFDDPAGTLSVGGWQLIRVEETDCTSAPVLFWGFIGDRTYRRGPYRVGGSREIDTTLVDSNTMLTCRIVAGAGANRPQETQAARLAWLLGTNAVVPMFSDLGLVNGSSKVLDAANYRGMYPAEVLNDLCTAREEIFFTYYDQSAQAIGLFFDVPTAAAFTSTLTFSNVLSDVNDVTCFEPHIDGELYVTPEDVYTTGSMVYTGGTEYAINTATYAFFDDPSPIHTRSFRIENDKVGKATTAHILLDKILAQDATEREVLKFTVRLPSTKVGLVQAGMRIQARFSHLPGFTSFAYTRIERLTCLPTDGDPTHYDVTLECSTHGLTTTNGSGGGSTDPFPVVTECSGVLVQSAVGYTLVGGNLTVSLPAAPTPGNLLVAWAWGHDAGTPGLTTPTGFTATPQGAQEIPHSGVANNAWGSIGLYYRIAQALDTGSVTMAALSDRTRMAVAEFAGNFTLDDSDSASFSVHNTSAPWDIDNPLGTVTLTGPSIVIGLGGWSGNADATYTIDRGTVLEGNLAQPGNNIGPMGCASYEWVSTAANVSPTMTETAVVETGGGLGYVVSFVCTASSEPPPSGKPVGPETPTPAPDGLTTTFTTLYSYGAGSLKVYVDNVDETAAIVSSDNTAGTFTLGFAPRSWETIVVYYIAL